MPQDNTLELVKGWTGFALPLFGQLIDMVEKLFKHTDAPAETKALVANAREQHAALQTVVAGIPGNDASARASSENLP